MDETTPGGTVRRRNWAVLALVPVLLAGCSAIPGLSMDRLDGTDTATEDAAADGPSWIVAEHGRPAPSAKPPAGTPRTPDPTGFLPLPTFTPTRTPVRTCSPNTFRFSRIDGMTVRPSTTSAVLNWYNVGGANLVEFRLYATSQDVLPGAQRDVGFVTVKPRAACGWTSATIGNLDRRTTYVFTVDAVVTRKSGDGTHAATVARSGAIRTR